MMIIGRERILKVKIAKKNNDKNNNMRLGKFRLTKGK